jgi:uncharacterized protein
MKLLRRAGRRPDTDPGAVALHARNVRFDWSDTPLRWMPTEPIASHLINSLNLLLPEGERMFCAAYAEALPYVRDEKLREAMLGFIGQESMHAETHDKVLHEVLAVHGIDPEPYLRQAEYLFRRTLGRRDVDGVAERQVLVERLAFIACLEHFFAYLGDWVLNADLERFGADPRMADLFRWHGAEEVEHRHVSFNVAKYFGMDHLAQALAGVMVSVVFFAMMLRGTKYLVHQDPALPNMRYPRLLWRLRKSGRTGALPTFRYLGGSGLTLLRRDYDPVDEGSTAQAVAYLATSPAARATHG